MLIHIISTDIEHPTFDNQVQDSGALVRVQSSTDTGTTFGSQKSAIVSDYEASFSQLNPPLKIDVMTPELASALDRANVSNRNATFVLAAAYQSIGINIETLHLSYSTIRRGRI